MGRFDWLESKVLRSVDQLRLWAGNPRLDPEEQYTSLRDYTSGLLDESGEKESFLKLVRSIASNGYIPADPVVVWKDPSNGKYYVAEGNRRVLALKLLRNPDKAPSSIRGFVRGQAKQCNRSDFEKIRVSVSPTFEDAEWYINQRHSVSSILKPWSRLQQQRWISGLYDKYNGDVDTVISITRLNKGELEYTLRILKLRDFALDERVLSKLTPFEIESVKSHRIPMTILERWFMTPVIREKWGVEFHQDTVSIVSNEASFFCAYAAFIKLLIHRNDDDVIVRVNTRTITSNLDGILAVLPSVSFESACIVDEPVAGSDVEDSTKVSDSSGGEVPTEEPKKTDSKRPLNKNPDRNQLVVDSCCLTTSNYKLDALFKEFKKIPVYRYNNCVAAMLRVFLDLSISEYIKNEGCKDEICREFKKTNFQDILLKQRLEFLKKNKLKSKTPECKVVEKLLNSSNEYSLDTLNNYVHGHDTHHTSRRTLNCFWDFLFPLFEKILVIECR